MFQFERKRGRERDRLEASALCRCALLILISFELRRPLPALFCAGWWNHESAPFKFTQDYMEIMGGPGSDKWERCVPTGAVCLFACRVFTCKHASLAAQNWTESAQQHFWFGMYPSELRFGRGSHQAICVCVVARHLCDELGSLSLAEFS